MNDLFRRAESILEAASVSGAASAATAIVLDRAGGVRILNSEGWTLGGIIREFGAAEVYMVRNRADSIAVEGWSTMDHCTISRKQTTLSNPPRCNPASPNEAYAARLQVIPRLMN